MTTTQHPSDRRADAPGTLTADFPGLRFSLVALLGFVGLGGIYGAVQMLADPYRPMGMSTHMIARTPFDSFLVPGTLLLLLVGVAPLFLAVGLLARTHLHLGWVVAYGVGLMSWIVTQWVVVDARLWLQPVIFGIGFATVALAAVLWGLEDHSRERGATP